MIKEDLKKQILRDLGKVRCEKFEEQYIEKYGESKEVVNSREQEELLTKIIKKKVTNEKDCKEIISALKDYEIAKNKEKLFWNEEYYQKGFIEGTAVTKTKPIKEDITSIIWGKLEDDILEYIEDEKHNRLKENEKYKEVSKEIKQLENKYPKVKDFLWEEEIAEFTVDEKKAILDMFQLYSTRALYEGQEMFRIGLHEGKAL